MEIGKKLQTNLSWETVFEDNQLKRDLEELILPDYITSCRWFAGKSSTIKHVRIDHAHHMGDKKQSYYILMLEVQFKEAFSQHYLLPLAYIPETEEAEYTDVHIISRLRANQKEGFLIDALFTATFRNLLFDHMIKNKTLSLAQGTLQFESSASLKIPAGKKVSSAILNTEQSNTAVIYNNQYFFKWFRRVFPESNPDLELSRFLNTNHFPYTPQYKGSVSWLRPDKPLISLGLMQQKLDNEGDAWKWILQEVNAFFSALDQNHHVQLTWEPRDTLFDPVKPKSLSPQTRALLGKKLLEGVVRMGKRTAQMHLALARDNGQVSFTPVAFNPDYSVWLKNKVTYLFDLRIGLLEKNIGKLRGLAREYGQVFLDRRNEVLEEILGFDETTLCSRRTRVHGDFHLGQVLVHDDEFYILDFEGEPESTIRDRKVKQSPLKDVAGMLRSFHYAIYATLFDEEKHWTLPQHELFDLAERFYQLLCGLYLQGFIRAAIRGGLDIGYRPEIHYLLRYHLLEKAVYELGYELNSRPAWAIIPLRGVMRIMGF